jgi:3-isopropylmalate/(R)-2-methylmalate dehydratase large subunit
MVGVLSSVYGPVLHLADDAEGIRRQLVGASGLGKPLPKLRDDVSTDEIIPLPAMVHFDAQLGRYPYTGVRVQGQNPIGENAIAQAGIRVVVGGKRYGKGSSREHAVVAERSAGVQLVIAESFERIYRQNADNVGLWTSTDFSLLDQLARGEPVRLEQVLQGRDPLAQRIVQAGGLLAFGRQALQALQEPAPQPAPGPRTLFEKIIAANRVQVPGLEAGDDVAFVRVDRRFIHEYYTGMIDHLLDHVPAGALHDPGSVQCFEDHLSYVHESPVHVAQGLLPLVNGLSMAHRAFVRRHGLAQHGYRHDLPAGDARNAGSQGISHAMMTERYARPGELIIGTDSHTTHLGAVGCVALGIGSTDMANALLTGVVRVPLAPSLLVRVTGALPAGVMAKDLVLHLLARADIRAGAGVGKVFEFAGQALQTMSVDERATLTNMCAELGGLTGVIAPDAETLRFLQERRGSASVDTTALFSDPDARYAQVIEVDAAHLTPWVAKPGDPGNGLALHDLPLSDRPHVDLAYGGSCTAGKRSDFDAYHAVLSWAQTHGLRLPEGTQLLLQYGTEDVQAYCQTKGYAETFSAMGVRVLHPACGACANCGPGVSTRTEQVTVSAINRNFPGRSGPGHVWLASPYTVVASALAGRIQSWEELKAIVQPRDGHQDSIASGVGA